MRDRVAQIVACFEYRPKFCVEVGQEELLSYVDLSRERTLPRY
jgi:hypothetical protein